MLNRALKLLRTYHQFSQTELANLLQISNSYLSEIESGVKAPSVDLIHKYALLFKMPTSSIFLFSEKITDGSSCAKKIKITAADKVLSLLEWINSKNEIEKKL